MRTSAAVTLPVTSIPRAEATVLVPCESHESAIVPVALKSANLFTVPDPPIPLAGVCHVALPATSEVRTLPAPALVLIARLDPLSIVKVPTPPTAGPLPIDTSLNHAVVFAINPDWAVNNVF